MNSSRVNLPRTPRDLFRFKTRERVVIDAVIAIARATGIWRYPKRANGDFEKMTFLDKVYWLHKATRPVARARRNSGLEEYFEKQRALNVELPVSFIPESEVRISSAGDLINHAHLANSKDTLYEGVYDVIFDADISMANLECPVITRKGKEFVFAMGTAPPLFYGIEEFFAVMGAKDRKFSFLATACNHSLDFGTEGARETLKILREHGIASSGMNEDASASRQASILTANGMRVGVVAYTFGLNGHKAPPSSTWIVNRMSLNESVASLELEQLKAQLDYCRGQDVDFVIAHLHWGMEHEFYPSPEQLEVAHAIAELGVDAIIGHHPHVLQPMEMYRVKRDPDRLVPIYYSLGNLVNSFSAPYLCRSGIAQLTLACGNTREGQRRVYVKSAKITEVMQRVDPLKKTLFLVPA